MVWKFLFLWAVTQYTVILGHILINRFFPAQTEPTKKESLQKMWEDGQLSSDIPIRYQLQEMSATDAEGNPVEMDVVEDMEWVDIDAARRKIALKNKQLAKNIVLEL